MATGMQFTDRAQKALGDAAKLAEQYMHSQISSVHLAVSLLDPPYQEPTDAQIGVDVASGNVPLFQRVVEVANGDVKRLDKSLKKMLVRIPRQDPPPDHINLGPSISKVVRIANEYSKNQDDKFVAVDHLIAALASDSSLQGAFDDADIHDVKVIQSAIHQIRGSRKVVAKREVEEISKPLKNFTRDMISMAREGELGPVVGREQEIRQIIETLLRRVKSNLILVSEPGVGKNAIVDGLARRIADNDVPVNLLDCQLLSLDMRALVAGSKDIGAFEESVSSVLNAIAQEDGEVILFIDNIHLIFTTTESANGVMGVGNLLRLTFAAQRLHYIGTSNIADYKKHIEKDPAFERQCQKLLVSKPSRQQTISILRAVRKRYELYHGVKILDPAIITAVSLASNHLSARNMPDSVIDLLDETCASVRVARECRPQAMDIMERSLAQLKFEIGSLEQEKDEPSRIRLKQLKIKATDLHEELDPMREHYNSIKIRSKEISDAKVKLDKLRGMKDEAERSNNLTRASDLMYYEIPDTQHRIQTLEAAKMKADEEWCYKGHEALDADVGPEQIKIIVARWTGIPVGELREGQSRELESAMGRSR